MKWSSQPFTVDTRVRHFATRYSTSEVSCRRPFHFLYFCLAFASASATQFQPWISIGLWPPFFFFTSPLANTYIMCNNIDVVLCIQFPQHGIGIWWILDSIGLTRRAVSLLKITTYLQASRQGRSAKSLALLTARFLVEICSFKGHFARYISELQFTKRCIYIYIIWYYMCGFGKSENNRGEIILRNHAV